MRHANRPYLALAAAMIGLLGLVACSSGGAGANKQAPASGSAAANLGPLADVTPASPQAAKPSGPAIQVVWEALARERELLETSRFRRKGQPLPPQRIVLLSESHPEASGVKSPRTKEERERNSGSAVLSDRDMQEFLAGLRRQGFFRYARPGGFDDSLVQSDNARGRIIVEQDGSTYTLLSLRGQGGNPQTREIPKIYSETKQAVMVLRNMTPTLNVSHYGYSGTAR
ncbi:MAG: hypothetical protein O2894_06335 [Planctomycetota bacterium]|nr:hypothetical protein [Planctomycetota bacterium]